jgi:hypothetical protein
MANIAQRLRDLGPGSRGVGFDRQDGPGHWFNDVNHQAPSWQLTGSRHGWGNGLLRKTGWL